MVSKLSSVQIKRISLIKAILDEVHPQSMDDWISGFELDAQTDREIMFWVCLAKSYSWVIKDHKMPKESKPELFQCLSNYALGMSEQQLLSRDFQHLGIDDIKNITCTYRIAADVTLSGPETSEETPSFTCEDAGALALIHMRNRINIEPCRDIPLGLYNFDSEEEYLFIIVKDDSEIPHRVGGDEYMAVSKSTGEVRYAGMAGE